MKNAFYALIIVLCVCVRAAVPADNLHLITKDMGVNQAF